MLEKTAASLEPCSLQRMLPTATKSFRSRRQLHTAFWQHGAADVELTNAWQALMHGVFDSGFESEPTEPSSDTRQPALRASGFLLDFLYPNGTVAFLRRFIPVSTDRLYMYKSGQSFARVSPRLYSSSVPSPETKCDSVQGKTYVVDHGRSVNDMGTAAEVTEVNDYETQNNRMPRSADETAADDAIAVQMQHSRHDSDPLERKLTTDETDEVFGNSVEHLEKLMKLLVVDNPEDADKVWLHYKSLDEQSRSLYLGQTLVFLSKTGRVTDSWKITELFYQMGVSRWDSYSFVAGLGAELNMQNLQKALDIFNQGLAKPDIEESSLVDALDLLLAAALKSSTMDFLRDIWKVHDQMAARFDFGGITSQLSRVASVPGLPEKVIELRLSFESKIDGVKLEALQKLLVRRALTSCADNQALALLQITNDHIAYEEFIRNPRLRGRRIITQVYDVYRWLPQTRPGRGVLYRVFDAYAQFSRGSAMFAGMEKLWADWHRFEDKAPRRAYQKFLAFYATNGDKKTVYRLWKDYVVLYADADVIRGDDTFAHLLQVHAVRQELSEVQRIFDEISGKFKLEPNRHCWNILLNAYVKAGDYEGALAVFEQLTDSVGADDFSYGTLMQMAADRGDLGLTVVLYRRALSQKINIRTAAVLHSLIQAYCQNDHFSEAEDVCVRAASNGMKQPRLWNTILHAYALRRNLANINRLLTLMTDLGVAYNEFTYQQLLLGLSLCRQSQHALHLLAVAIKDNAFEVNEDHFHTLMGAFIKNGEYDVATRIFKLMQECGFAASGDSLVQLITAFSQWNRLSHTSNRGHSREFLLGSALRRFYQNYGIRNVEKRRGLENRSSSREHLPANKLLRSDPQAFQFSKMIYLFTQMKDHMKVQELLEMYRYITQGDAKSTSPLPIQMLNSIMWADLSEKRHDNVLATWKIMFDMAREGSLSAEWSDDLPHTQKVLPRYQYILSEGLKVMQTMYLEQEDLISLQKLIEEVRIAGFQIDSRNWNLYVQGLIRLKSYREAFETCEKWLMPNWTGWARVRAKENMKNKVPLDLRRKGSWPRHLRPDSHTLYHLAKGYMELDKMGPWSAEATKVLAGIKRDNPRCYRAVVSMIRANTPLEQQILGDEPPVMSAEDDIEAMYEEDGEFEGDDGHRHDSGRVEEQFKGSKYEREYSR
ncbi:hypothetical protein BJ170DRAFT_612741 [Xylariales sp. AK1849]|nr:hypothetical protein BJ170DRAFT_612741 [Xylariales sp. AK1849]